jgi:hypothetical protein
MFHLLQVIFEIVENHIMFNGHGYMSFFSFFLRIPDGTVYNEEQFELERNYLNYISKVLEDSRARIL